MSNFSRKLYTSLIIVVAITLINSNIHSEVIATSDQCKTVTAAFARGSGQSLGDKESDTFRQQLESRIGKDEVNFYELGSETYGDNKYPAVDTSNIFNGNAIGAYFSGGIGNDYGKSVDQGVAELRSFLRERNQKCPDEFFILGGYSQGAQVIGQALSSTLPAVRERIVFSALFGDPKLYLPEGEGIFPPACDGKSYSPYRREIANCHVDNGSLGARKPYTTDYDSNKVGLWCLANDFVCGSTKFFWDNDGHSKYSDGNGPIYSGAREAATRLKTALANSSIANNINDKPTNNNMGTTGTDVVFVLDTTGSMSGYINKTKEFIRNFSSKITENNGRVGLVLYRDLGDQYTAKKVSDLQSDTSHILQQLNEAYVDGGGDYPEAALHASITAMNTMNWKQGATKAIILLTDASAHHPDKVDGSTVDSVAKRSLEIDPVNIYPVVEEDLVDDYMELAEKTSGQVIVNQSESETVAALNNALTKIKNRPNAKLKIGAYYSQVGHELTFDASDSYVVDGEIIKYEWDFDGDSTIDKITDQPVVNHVYNEKFDGHMQVRMWANNDTVSNISVPVKIGVESSDLVGSAAPTVATKVTNKNGTRATVVLSWSAADSLAERWIIRQNDNNLGWVVGSQNQLEIRDVDLSEVLEYSVTGVTKDGLVGESGSATAVILSTTPSPGGGTGKICRYKFQIDKLLISCRYEKEYTLVLGF